MEERLQALIDRINASTLSDEEKAQLFAAISGGLQASIWPSLLKYVPEGEADTLLAETDDKKRVERFSQLIGDAMEKGNALDDVEETMNKLLDEVEAALNDKQI